MPGNTNALNNPTWCEHNKMLEQLISPKDEQLVFIESTDIRENEKPPLTPKVIDIKDFQDTKIFTTCFRILSQIPQSENEVNKIQVLAIQQQHVVILEQCFDTTEEQPVYMYMWMYPTEEYPEYGYRWVLKERNVHKTISTLHDFQKDDIVIVVMGGKKRWNFAQLKQIHSTLDGHLGATYKVAIYSPSNINKMRMFDQIGDPHKFNHARFDRTRFIDQFDHPANWHPDWQHDHKIENPKTLEFMSGRIGMEKCAWTSMTK